MDEWDTLVTQSRMSLGQRHAAIFAALPEADHWHYDMDEAVLEIFSCGQLVRQFAMTVVGSTSEAENTWLWSWANDALPTASTGGMETVRQFGEAHGHEALVVPEWPAQQPYVGDVVAVAGEILGAAAFFRSSGADVALYMLLDTARSA